MSNVTLIITDFAGECRRGRDQEESVPVSDDVQDRADILLGCHVLADHAAAQGAGAVCGRRGREEDAAADGLG